MTTVKQVRCWAVCPELPNGQRGLSRGFVELGVPRRVLVKNDLLTWDRVYWYRFARTVRGAGSNIERYSIEARLRRYSDGAAEGADPAIVRQHPGHYTDSLLARDALCEH